ncbi:MAG: hypothetical protein H8F28_00950 [Fibrella sp.]|nr:hypothetical protein [Armatimonadota bacterium]
MKIHQQTHSRFFAGVAVIVLLFFCGTLTASLGISVAFVPRVNPVGSALAAVTPSLPKAVACLCVSCDAHNKPGGGKCCCTGANTASETLAFRAVCDTPLDAVMSGSLFPPVVLPLASVVRVSFSLTALPIRRFAFAEHRTGNGAPLPPHAPPRFF